MHNGIGDGQSGSFLPFLDGDYGIQGFLSLSEAVEIALDWNTEVFPNMNIFPLFSVEEVMYWIVGSEALQDTLPIYSGDIDPSFTQQATSLTAFLENGFAKLHPRKA